MDEAGLQAQAYRRRVKENASHTAMPFLYQSASGSISDRIIQVVSQFGGKCFNLVMSSKVPNDPA